MVELGRRCGHLGLPERGKPANAAVLPGRRCGRIETSSRQAAAGTHRQPGQRRPRDNGCAAWWSRADLAAAPPCARRRLAQRAMQARMGQRSGEPSRAEPRTTYTHHSATWNWNADAACNHSRAGAGVLGWAPTTVGHVTLCPSIGHTNSCPLAWRMGVCWWVRGGRERAVEERGGGGGSNRRYHSKGSIVECDTCGIRTHTVCTSGT